MNGEDKKNYIELYTDGSYDMRKKRGGWGCYMELNFSKKGYKRLYGKEEGTTINRLELLATINGLEYLTKHGFNKFPTTLYTDSQYVVDEVNHSSNLDLWEKYKELKEGFEDLKIEWMKGHEEEKNGNTIAHYLSKKYKYDENDKKKKQL